MLFLPCQSISSMGFAGSTGQRWGGFTSCDTRVGMFPLPENTVWLKLCSWLQEQTTQSFISPPSSLKSHEGEVGIKIAKHGCRFTLICLLTAACQLNQDRFRHSRLLRSLQTTDIIFYTLPWYQEEQNFMESLFSNVVHEPEFWAR